MKNIKINIFCLLLIIAISFILGVKADSEIFGSNVVSYDNTNSSIEATSIQGAIDELNDRSEYGNALVVQTGDNYTSTDILSGKTALVGGKKVTGSLATNTSSGNVTLTASTKSKSYPAGYYSNAHGAQISPTSITPSTSGASMSTGTLYTTSAAGYLYTQSGLIKPSGTYTYPTGSTGGNVNVTNYATVNAANVYAKGKADGTTSAKASGKVNGSTIGYGENYTITTGLSNIKYIAIYSYVASTDSAQDSSGCYTTARYPTTGPSYAIWADYLAGGTKEMTYYIRSGSSSSEGTGTSYTSLSSPSSYADRYTWIFSAVNSSAGTATINAPASGSGNLKDKNVWIYWYAYN